MYVTYKILSFSLSPIQVQEYLEGSDFYGNYQDWTKARKIISKHTGTKSNSKVLDIGCANGFLLYCLTKWGSSDQICYGIDTNPVRITEAKKLFPSQPDHFQVDNMFEGNWVNADYDVIISPWTTKLNYLDTVDTYIKNSPSSIIIFTLYDDKSEDFLNMELMIKDRWADKEIEFDQVENITKIAILKT